MNPPAPHGPVPSARQLRWHALELYGFVHFTVNTFTDQEWGYGDESAQVFNPTALDTRQWARVAKDAGLRGLILTAKHHDGFCLWPSAYTEHSVKRAPWKAGAGDVVQELHDACAEYGLQMGLYLSPWDRNHAEYGSEGYLAYYQRQLRELLGRYPGELFEMWFDGANGGDGYYGGARETRTIDRRTYYRFPELIEIVRALQPHANIFSDAGPDVRWVGNEAGRASATCWSKIKPEGMYPGNVDDTNRLAWGEADGSVWRPAEVDVSIRPGWFYHPHEQPCSLNELVEIYFASVGYGCNMLLNLPPDRRGLIPEEDVRRLHEFRQALDAIFAHDVAQGQAVTASQVRGDDPAYSAAHLTDGDPDSYWSTDDDVRTATIEIELGGLQRIGCVRLEEYIPLGQRVESFTLEVKLWEQWLQIALGTTIGSQRILRVPPITTDKLRLRITASQACPVLRRVAVYTAVAG
jgi:alpha-L-fucosidase